MVKIYIMKSPIVGDDILFKELEYSNPQWSLSDEGLESKKKGGAIPAKWGVDSSDKPLGDRIMFPGSGLASSKNTIEHFKKFVPGNMTNPITIDGQESDFVFLQPKNYNLNASCLEHFFMMFSKHKGLLITEFFKDEWERLNLTGAEFVHVDTIAESRFIAIE